MFLIDLYTDRRFSAGTAAYQEQQLCQTVIHSAFY